MIHISIDYTGNIPGLGRGPFTNILISNTVYARLKAIGYPIKVLSSDKIIRNTVKKPAAPSVQPVVAKPATPAIEKGTAKVDVNVVMSAPVDSVPITIEVTKPEEPKVSEVVEEKVEETSVEVTKQVTKEDLDGMTKEELDELLNKYTTERPSRYGKPWLIKMLKTYI